MMNDIVIRELAADELCRSLFDHFNRHQVVTRCVRKTPQGWCVVDSAFTDDWSETDYLELVSCLRCAVKDGGVVYGAFCDGELKGFASVESKPQGSDGGYRDLSDLHVSEDMRRKGIGNKLFFRAAEWAKAHGGRKLYISSQSSVESQAFYRAMGCVEAAEYNEEHVKKEPCDCQLEYTL